MANQDSINGVKTVFNSKLNIDSAIDLQHLFPISLTSAEQNPELKRFFWLDDGPFSEILQRGMQSVRQGFYKICSQPYYRTNIFPGTFAATVYYWNPQNKNLIKYHANIGPIANTSMVPYPFNDGIKSEKEIPILKKFLEDKSTYGWKDDYMEAKKNFFNSIFIEDRIIFIEEADWDPAYPTINKRKRIKWCFIDY